MSPSAKVLEEILDLLVLLETTILLPQMTLLLLLSKQTLPAAAARDHIQVWFWLLRALRTTPS